MKRALVVDPEAVRDCRSRAEARYRRHAIALIQRRRALQAEIMAMIDRVPGDVSIEAVPERAALDALGRELLAAERAAMQRRALRVFVARPPLRPPRRARSRAPRRAATRRPSARGGAPPPGEDPAPAAPPPTSPRPALAAARRS